MAFVEDLSIFFQDFAISVTFRRGAAVVANVQAIFDNPTALRGLVNTDVAEDVPVLLCITSEITSVRRNDLVTVNGVEYRVDLIHAEDDGAFSRVDLIDP